MMNKREFCNYVEENLLSVLDISDATVKVSDVRKNNNVILSGLVVQQKGQKVLPTIYLESYFEEYEMGYASLDEVIVEIATAYQNAIDNNPYPFFHQSMLSKDKVIGTVINRHFNEDFLRDVPYVEFLDDYAIIFKVLLDIEVDGTFATVTITDYMAEFLNMTTEELLTLALENTPKLCPVELKNMTEVIADIMGVAQEDLFFDEEEVKMYYLSNKQRNLGCFSIFTQECRQRLQELFDGDIYVIPSSIHEFLIVPNDGQRDFEELTEIISMVNENEVSEEQLLGSKPFLLKREEGYNAVNGLLSIAIAS